MNGTLHRTGHDGHAGARTGTHTGTHTGAHAHLTLVPAPGAAGQEHLPPPVWRPAPLRLTRRGRVVVVVLFLGALLAGGVLFGSTSTRASGEAGPARSYEYVLVQPGQTLWGIAKQVAPQDDPRATIEAIRRLNALPDGGIQAGQRIALQ